MTKKTNKKTITLFWVLQYNEHGTEKLMAFAGVNIDEIRKTKTASLYEIKPFGSNTLLLTDGIEILSKEQEFNNDGWSGIDKLKQFAMDTWQAAK